MFYMCEILRIVNLIFMKRYNRYYIINQSENNAINKNDKFHLYL